MTQLLLVALGGAIGSALRHLTNIAGLRLLGAGFPWGTFAVNILGSFLMGLVVELLARRLGASEGLRLFLATGILGGYTTFSAFSLDTIVMAERGAVALAMLYVAASVALALIALMAGLALARTLA
jgi:CrcB protein